MKKSKCKIIQYDCRLSLPLDFACKTLDVSKKDFVTLALSSLLEEELDNIKINLKRSKLGDIEELVKIVKAVKYEICDCKINEK